MIQQALKIVGEELDYSFKALRYRKLLGPRSARKLVVVNGSPKTGTTWMVRLLTSIPGYRAVGHFRGDLGRWAQIEPGDVVHDHAKLNEGLLEIVRGRQIKIVLMVRDPRDQAVSRMFHIRRDRTHQWHHVFRQMSDDEALMACIEGRPRQDGLHALPSAASMTRLTFSWLRREGDSCCLVRYEDLLAGASKELHRVFTHLEIPPEADFVDAIVKRNRFERLVIGKRIWRKPRRPGEENPSSHFRKGVTRDWRNYFKESHSKRIQELIGDALVEWGYARAESPTGPEIGSSEESARGRPSPSAASPMSQRPVHD